MKWRWLQRVELDDWSFWIESLIWSPAPVGFAEEVEFVFRFKVQQDFFDVLDARGIPWPEPSWFEASGSQKLLQILQKELVVGSSVPELVQFDVLPFYRCDWHVVGQKVLEIASHTCSVMEVWNVVGLVDQIVKVFFGLDLQKEVRREHGFEENTSSKQVTCLFLKQATCLFFSSQRNLETKDDCSLIDLVEFG